MSDKLLTQSETAELLRRSPRQLEQWRWLGEGPPYLRVGRRILYRESDLEAWLDGCRVDPIDRAG